VLTFPQTSEFLAQISRDGARVGYVFGSANAFSGPINGGTGVRLNGDEEVGGFLRAGTGRFVYNARLGTLPGLFSAAQNGGARRHLTQSLGALTTVSGKALTPNGRTVVYTVLRPGTDAPVELYSSEL
jgi:hypothetical protein